MSKKHAEYASPPDWDSWPAETTVGNCKITVYHSDDSPPRALTLLAEPAASHRHGDLGASIFCSLPTVDPSNVIVRPPISTYWSSRRRGPSTKKYFSDGYPKLEVALLHALDNRGARSERGIAALYLLFSGHREGLQLQEEDNFPNLVNDETRFRAIANKWIALEASTEEGSRRITAARRHVTEARKWNESLEDFAALSPLFKLGPGDAKQTQRAVYKAIQDAALANGGVPLLRQVRESYHEVGFGWDKEKSKFRNDSSNSDEPLPDLRFEAFDTAIKKLGFSWLPKAWNPSSDSDLSD